MNWRFVEDVLDTLPEKNRQAALKAMKKYGENRWWRSNDPVEIAQYQVSEDILLVPFGLYHEGIEKLLGRPVYTHEFRSSNMESLQEEAREAMELRKIGAWDAYLNSEEGQKRAAKRVSDGIMQFEELFRKRGKEVIYVKTDEKAKNSEE